jgi:signal transduction histidine kinase
LQIPIAGAETGGVIVHLTQGSISGVAGASPTAAIADTDVGIPADELAKVTKPFSQIDSRLARKHEETGLGLALVYSLVAAYAGLH